MEFREPTEDDAETIRSIARDSLSASYGDFLDEETRENAVDRWYSDEVLADALESDHDLFLVAENDDGIVAFSQSELVGEAHDIGQILWLHVGPEYRERGTGVRLLVRTREELIDAGADRIHAVVVEENERGNEFYTNHGFERAGDREIEIGGETYTENVYVESDVEAGAEEADWRSMEPHELDGTTIYVSYGEASRGSLAPFYSAYERKEGTNRYGWFCGNCDTVDNAMDAMGRIECNRCGNRRKATRWDDSYL